jgi:large subunit ribosomal protein L15
MKYNELTLAKNKSARRAGRGISAGRGKTAGRGTKGQGARKSSIKAGFAGGQTPLYMQLPKLRGFKSKRIAMTNIYTGQLDSLKAVNIDNEVLFNAGLISSAHSRVKLIFKGEIKNKKIIKVQAASAGAIAVVEAAGGTVEIILRTPRPITSKNKPQKNTKTPAAV